MFIGKANIRPLCLQYSWDPRWQASSTSTKLALKFPSSGRTSQRPATEISSKIYGENIPSSNWHEIWLPIESGLHLQKCLAAVSALLASKFSLPFVSSACRSKHSLPAPIGPLHRTRSMRKIELHNTNGLRCFLSEIDQIDQFLGMGNCKCHCCLLLFGYLPKQFQ